MVESGEVEIGIGPYPENEQPFEVDFLVEDRFVAVLPASHHLARRRVIRLKDLAREPFIALQTGHSVRSTLSRAFGTAGLEFAPIYDLMHHFSIGGMVQAGLGVTALPSMALPLLNQSGLVSVPIAQPSVSRVIGLIRRKGTAPSPAARELHATLTACVATFPGTSGLRRGAGAKAGRS
jgi:DNA-binding transcriptional LysR family regulator